MRTFLFKTEPSEYSFADLVRDKSTPWTGVKNAAALQALRTAKVGDDVLVYHTGDEKAIVGLARIAKGPRQDPDQPGVTPEGFPKFAVVDLAPIAAAPRPVTLAQIKADKRFAEFALVKQSRLSVMLVPTTMDKALRKLAGW